MVNIRKEQQITDGYLHQLIQDDSLGRNNDISSFIQFIDGLDGGASIFIDGDWGSGKTLFVRQIARLLQIGNNPNGQELTEDEKADAELILDDLQLDTTFLPVYFNAWEHDTYDTPLLSLLGEMVDEVGVAEFGKIEPSNEDKFVTLLDAVLKPLRLDVAHHLKSGFTAKDLLVDLKERKLIQNRIQDLINGLLGAGSGKLILFIDELDRCSPKYAVQMLEQIKFLFTLDNVLIIFSTNVTQLTHTVKSFYGSGYNGYQYLSRFYDELYELRTVKPSHFLSTHNSDDNTGYIYKIFAEIGDASKLALRDCIQYQNDFRVIKRAAQLVHDDVSAQLIVIGFAPAIFSLKITGEEEHKKVMSGEGVQELIDLAMLSPSFQRFSSKCMDQMNRNIRIDADRFLTYQDYLNCVYDEFFRDDYDHDSRPHMFRWANIEDTKKALFGIG